MTTDILNTSLQIGQLTLPHRLIQGPLAGYSCAPFRRLFRHFLQPAYCVTEMISATDVLTKHQPTSRYLYRAPDETRLAYQLSGTCVKTMKQAALRCEDLGASLIDINCGCPKGKIRRKGAGSALLENPALLTDMISAVKSVLSIPLTVKVRLLPQGDTIALAKAIELAGADALVVHGRSYLQDYHEANNWQAIGTIKQALQIPVIGNGDISDISTLKRAIAHSHCDAYMIGRAGTGKPWLYQQLLIANTPTPDMNQRKQFFMMHLRDLAKMEGEIPALFQSRSLLRYYFGGDISQNLMKTFYQCQSLEALATQLSIFDGETAL